MEVQVKLNGGKWRKQELLSHTNATDNVGQMRRHLFALWLPIFVYNPQPSMHVSCGLANLLARLAAFRPGQASEKESYGWMK